MEGPGLVAVMVLAVLAKVPSCGGVCRSDTEAAQRCQDDDEWTTNKRLQSNKTISDVTVLFENPGWSVSQSFSPNLSHTDEEASSMDVSITQNLILTDDNLQSVERQFQYDGYTWNSQETQLSDGYCVVNSIKSVHVNNSFWSVRFCNTNATTSVSVETPLGKVTLTASPDAKGKSNNCTIEIAVLGKTDLEFENVTMNGSATVDCSSNRHDERTAIESFVRSNDSHSKINQTFTIRGIQINVLYSINSTDAEVMVCLPDNKIWKTENNIAFQTPERFTLVNNLNNFTNFDWSASFFTTGTTLIESFKKVEYLSGSDMSLAFGCFCKNIRLNCEENVVKNSIDCCTVNNSNSVKNQTIQFQWTRSLNTEIVIQLEYKSTLHYSVLRKLSSYITTPAGSLRWWLQQTSSQQRPLEISFHVNRDKTGLKASFATCSGNSSSLHLHIDTQQNSTSKVHYCSSMTALCSLVESSSLVNCSMSSIDQITSTITPSTSTTSSANSSRQVSQTTASTSVTGTSSSRSTHTLTVAPSSSYPNSTVSTSHSTTLSTTLSTIESSTVRQIIQALKSDSQVIPIAVGVAVPAVVIILLVVVIVVLARRRRLGCPGPTPRAGARGPYDDLNGYQNSSEQTRIYNQLNGNSGENVDDIHFTGLNGPVRTSDYYSVIKDGTATRGNGAFEPMNSIYNLAKAPLSEAKTDPAPLRNVTDETSFSSPYEFQVNVDEPPELPPKKKSACLNLHDKFDDELDIETPSKDCPQHQNKDAAESLYDTVRASAAYPSSHDGLYDTVNRTATTSGHFRPDSQGAAGPGRTGDYHFLDPEPEEPATEFPPLPPKTKQAVDGNGLYHYLDPETPLEQTQNDKESYQTVDVNSDADPSHGHHSAVGEVGGEYSSLNINGKRKNLHDATAKQETEVYSHLQDGEEGDYNRLDREGHRLHVLDEDYSRLQQ